MLRLIEKLKTLSKSTVAAVLAALVLCGGALAWYIGETSVRLARIQGTILLQYFHCGEGTAEKPFVITRPIHYYHLVELYQRLPEQFAEQDYYFQIGYDLDNDGDLEVYDYSDNGTLLYNNGQPKYSDTLNMAYYDASIPSRTLLPIGTSNVPFNGHYDGKDLTVSNLHIVALENSYDASGNPATYGTCDVGIFGYIGAEADVHHAYFDNVTLDLRNLSTTTISTADGHTAAVHADDDNDSTTNKAFVGYLAGHIKTAANVTDVYVNNSTILGGDAATCGFGYFGCVEDNHNAEVETLGSEVATLRTAGNDAGFGGSLDMKALYTRLDSIWSLASQPTTFVSAETYRVDEVENTTTLTGSSTSAMHFDYDGDQTIYFRYYETEKAGKYFYFKDTSVQSTRNRVYMCLYGEGSRYPKTVTTYTYMNQFDEDGLYISNGSSYLNASLTGVSSGAQDTIWQLDGDGHLHFFAETDTEIVTRYLNASSDGSLSVSATDTTVWTRNDDGTLTCTMDDRTWYLCDGGTWSVYPFSDVFTLSIGSDYLGRTASDLLGTGADHLAWHLEDGKLMTFYNGTIYYLNAAGHTLSLGTDAASATDTWAIDEDGVVSYTDGEDAVWYLLYSAGSWSCYPFHNAFTISDGSGNYLGMDGGVASVAEADALCFVLDGGDLTTYYNGALRYLDVSAGALVLSASAPSVSWSMGAGGAGSVTYSDGDHTWYLRYAGGVWDVYPGTSYSTVGDGSYYLNVSAGAFGATDDAAAASRWIEDSGKLYTASQGTVYYLCGSADGSGTLSLTTDAAAATVWSYTSAGGPMYYTAGGETWYLYDVSGSWRVYPAAAVSFVSQYGVYLNADSATTVTGGGSGTSAWVWDADNGTLSTFYGGAWRYLTAAGGSVSLSDTSATVWTRAGDGTLYVGGLNLYYSGGWQMQIPSYSYYVIHSGNNYLTGALGNGGAGAAAEWHMDGSGHIFLSSSAYLHADLTDGLSLTDAASATEFTYDSVNQCLTCTLNGATAYVVFDGSSWTVVDSLITYDYISTTSGNTTYYLNGGSGGVATDTDPAAASKWAFVDGKLFTVSSGTTYYLRAALETNNRRSSTNLTTTTDPAEATSFTYSNSNLSCTLNNTTYRLSLDNGALKMVNTSVTYYTILVGSDTQRYLNLSETTFQTDGTSADSATLWSFSNNSVPNNRDSTSTTISTLVNGVSRYLTLQSGNVSTATAGTDLEYYRRNDHYYIRLYVDWWTTYYLRFNQTSWDTSTSRSDTEYITRTAVTFSAASVSMPSGGGYSGVTCDQQTIDYNAANTFTDASGATLTFTADVSGDFDHGFGALPERAYSSAAQPIVHTFEAARRQHYSKAVTTEHSGYQTYFPLRTAVSGEQDYDANDPYKVSEKNTGYVISAARIEDTDEDDFQKLAGDIRVSYFPIDQIADSYSKSSNSKLSMTTICSGSNYLCINSTKDGVTNGAAANASYWYLDENNKLSTDVGGKTYYLTLNGTALTVTQSASSAVAWTNYNTYYLRTSVSGTNYYIRYSNGWTTGTSTTGSSLTLVRGTFTTIYTVNDSGINQTPTATPVFEQAKKQLLKTLSGSTSVYGLHFMDSRISTEHLLTAPYASVFGQPFTNYEMPEDSIDFHVIERGTISFFAGTYFTNNNTFFSLHQVFRNDDASKTVSAIREIVEVYQHKTLGDKANYIYKYSDNTYSNADCSYTGATTLDPAYSSTPVFKTSWITNPGISQGTRLYYFEIPCNAGEYCLGSVPTKNGAYLIYLDIATNGGDTIASAVSSTGNDVVNSFNVEFRNEPMTVHHTILQFQINAPAVANPADFSVSVSFDPTNTVAPHTAGLYTITVVNKSGVNAELYVYLCDDDFSLLTSFPYAYQIKYINTDHADLTSVTTAVGDTFQMMAGFVIPSTGAAVETNYG